MQVLRLGTFINCHPERCATELVKERESKDPANVSRITDVQRRSYRAA